MHNASRIPSRDLLTGSLADPLILGSRPGKTCALELLTLRRRLLSEVSRHSKNPREVGGSVILAGPPALPDLLNLGMGAKVGIGVEDGRLVVESTTRPRYTLEELLAQCDDAAAPSAEDRAWLDVRPVGNELL